MEIICTDGKFSPEAIETYKKYGVSTPQQDKMYNIREVVKNTAGERGLLLEEI